MLLIHDGSTQIRGSGSSFPAYFSSRGNRYDDSISSLSLEKAKDKMRACEQANF